MYGTLAEEEYAIQQVATIPYTLQELTLHEFSNSNLWDTGEVAKYIGFVNVSDQESSLSALDIGARLDVPCGEDEDEDFDPSAKKAFDSHIKWKTRVRLCEGFRVPQMDWHFCD